MFFFQSIPNFFKISDMQKKIQKIFFDCDIIVFECLALNTPFD